MKESREEKLFDFDIVAEMYDSAKYLIRPAERLVAVSNLASGANVLDVACGTGWATLVAAKAVGTSGMVTGIDIATNLLGMAQQKAATAGILNTKFLVGNAEALEFKESSFDNVICASSIFLFKDAGRVLNEWYRVLKPGGNVAFNTYGQGSFHPVSEIFHNRLVQFEEKPSPRRQLRLADPDRCKDLLDNVGLINTRVITEDLGLYFDGKEECWNYISNELPSRQRIASLSPTKLEAFKGEFLKDINHLLTNQGIWISLPVNFCIGEKPY